MRASVDLDVLVMPGPWTTVPDRLARVCAQMGDELAVSGPDQRLSFAEFGEQVQARAAALHAEGPPIWIEMDGTTRCVIDLFGVIEAGRLAVPLDPMYPPDRAAQILQISSAVPLSAALQSDAVSAPADREITPGGGAVVIFTSGSTGAPKGCIHTQQGWLNQAYVGQTTHGQEPGVRNAMILPMSYGGGLDVIFFSLLNGASLHIRDPRLAGVAGIDEWFREERITAIHTTPSLLSGLLDRGVTFGSELTVITSGGEPVPRALVHRARAAACAPLRFGVICGASEAGSLFYYEVGPDQRCSEDGYLPVGWPVANREFHLVDSDGAVVAAGEPGMLRVASPYLTAGYFNDEVRTAETFEDLGDGRTLLRASDLARQDDDGAVVLLGRADDAVKIGGYLVAPIEVEATVLRLPGVGSAVVTARRDERGRSELVAHVVPKVQDQPVTAAGIRRALRDELPSWMIPTEVTVLPELPRNERGKIDRAKLPAPPVAPVIEPRSPTESLITEIWRDVLGTDRVSVDDDFWARGADSLAVEEMLAAVGAATGVTIHSGALVAMPTPAELARFIDERRSSDSSLPRTAVQLRSGDHDAPVLHTFAGGGAPALSLLPLVGVLDGVGGAYGYQASGYESRGRPDVRLASVVTRHRKVIEEVSDAAPIVLMGHSFGAYVALATAHQLRERGREPALTVLLDPILMPGAIQKSGLRQDARWRDEPLDTPGRMPGTSMPRHGLARRWWIHTRLLGQGWWRYSPTTRNEVFWEASLRMVNRHQMRPWSGRTLVFIAADNANNPKWWDALLPGPHELITVDGGHSSILRPPFNAPIARRIDEELALLGASETTN